MADIIILENHSRAGPKSRPSPISRPGHVRAHCRIGAPGLFTTASSSTVSSTDSWPRRATPTGTGMGGSGTKLKGRIQQGQAPAGAQSRWPAPVTRIPGDSQFFHLLRRRLVPWMGNIRCGGQVVAGMENVDKIKTRRAGKGPGQDRDGEDQGASKRLFYDVIPAKAGNPSIDR